MDARDRSPVISQPFFFLSFFLFCCFILNTFLLFILFASSLTLHFVVVVYFFSGRVFFFFLLIRHRNSFLFSRPFVVAHDEKKRFTSFYLYENLSCPCSLLLIQSCCMRPNAQLFSSFLKLEKLQRDEREIRGVCEVLHKKIKCPYTHTHSLYLLLLLQLTIPRQQSADQYIISIVIVLLVVSLSLSVAGELKRMIMTCAEFFHFFYYIYTVSRSGRRHTGKLSLYNIHRGGGGLGEVSIMRLATGLSPHACVCVALR